MKVLRGVGRFCYDFVIGDDWKIATVVVVSVVLATLLVTLNAPSTAIAVVTALVLMMLFSLAVVLDVRRNR
jgi:hypothetical protein